MERHVRVLIADDQRPARKGLKALLALFPGVDLVGEATNGQESLSLVAERQPDVVLMDVQMPLLDGLEATRRIKSRWPRVRVVVLTLHEEYRKRALAAGADAFLLKGCPVQTLEDTIAAQPRAELVSGASSQT